ncbi:MAG: hypothetical protein JWM56_19 [Candidatus Peribacteria bacterium]|nr:hypothetical protein [Candidatus Peribacteria bacterium]
MADKKIDTCVRDIIMEKYILSFCSMASRKRELHFDALEDRSLLSTVSLGTVAAFSAAAYVQPHIAMEVSRQSADTAERVTQMIAAPAAAFVPERSTFSSPEVHQQPPAESATPVQVTIPLRNRAVARPLVRSNGLELKYKSMLHSLLPTMDYKNPVLPKQDLSQKAAAAEPTDSLGPDANDMKLIDQPAPDKEEQPMPPSVHIKPQAIDDVLQYENFSLRRLMEQSDDTNEDDLDGIAASANVPRFVILPPVEQMEQAAALPEAGVVTRALQKLKGLFRWG